MSKKPLLLVLMSLVFCFASPVAKANDLACAALMCLSGGASCSSSKYPACGPSLGQYCKILGLLNGFSKATNWLGTCKFEGSPAVTKFAMNCTQQSIFSHLYVTDTDGNSFVALDVPESCKQFPQQIRAQNELVLAQVAPEHRNLIQDTSLLPVLSVRWNLTYFYEENSWVHVPVYSWNYATEIPDGYARVYDPNTGTKFQCPGRYPGDRLSFVAKVGCM